MLIWVVVLVVADEVRPGACREARLGFVTGAKYVATGRGLPTYRRPFIGETARARGVSF